MQQAGRAVEELPLMTRRIVLYGATGYTGRLVATRLSKARMRPVLAGRSLQSLHALGVTLGKGLETFAADVADHEGLLALIREGDVVVSTAGPFTRFGTPVAEACVVQRATYIDSCGEPPFIRMVFEQLGPVAASRDTTLIPGFGFEFVAGNVASALALQAAGDGAQRVDVGYFLTGRRLGRLSAGTRASAGQAALVPHYAWRDSQLVDITAGDRIVGFPVDGSVRQAFAIGGSEHFALPRLHPELREVGVYLGGPKSQRVAKVAASVVASARKVPGAQRIVGRATSLPSVREGPDEEVRARFGTMVIATAYDADDQPLHSVRMAGVDPYTFTSRLLAWAAQHLSQATAPLEPGTLGPVQAFGLDTLVQACADAGLEVVPES
jgi:short subunit dehydrogenase-like uncharacterized protein